MGADPFAAISLRRRWLARLRRWALTAGRPLSPAPAPRRSGPPNLCLAAVDTLRYDHLGLAGYGRRVSPALDRLAAAGVSFADVTAAAPWTLPSFASALTGVMPSVHGAGGAGPLRNLDRSPPRAYRGRPPTLAQHLAAHGYRTAAFYANPFVGFGLAETFQSRRYANLPAAELAFLALEWMRRAADRPFFCFILFNDPHEPTCPPRALLRPLLADLARRGLHPEPRRLGALARWGDARAGVTELGRVTPPAAAAALADLEIKLALYDAAIAAADAAVGTVAASLARWGLAKTTLLAVVSDHGEEFHDHLEDGCRRRHDPRGIAGIGHGHSLFQELLRVPWVAAGPGVPRGGSDGVVVTEPVSLCDLAPTLCDWLGVPPPPLPAGLPDGLTGRSAAALARDSAAGGLPAPRAPDLADQRVLLAEDIAYGPDMAAARRGRWKLIARRDGKPLALFDLQDDPAERRDLRGARPDIVAALAGDLAAWRAALTDGAGGAPASDGGGPGGAEPPPGWESISDRVRRQLKELGYSD